MKIFRIVVGVLGTLFAAGHILTWPINPEAYVVDALPLFAGKSVGILFGIALAVWAFSKKEARTV